jgi:hypothetical protein
MLAALPAILNTPDASAGTYGPTVIGLSASDGTGRIQSPGRSCSDGGDGNHGTGAYWHYDYSSDVAKGVFSQIPTKARVHVDLHSNRDKFPNTGGVYPTTANPNGFLQGSESHASLLNERGAVKLRLTSGSCAAPSLNFNGENFSGAGDWVVDRGSGSYRDITGLGTFTVANGEVNPGADNALAVTLNGTFVLPDPSLQVQVVRTFWGGLGTDYLTRRVSVQYRITNTGPGDAFGARLVGATSPTPGVTPMGPVPQGLFDMPEDDTRLVTVRYQLGALKPCALIILNCPFNSTLTVEMPDALDVMHVYSQTVAAKAPNLPPPL